MKKTIYILSSLFLTIVLQAQIIPQPEPTAPPTINIGKSNNFELKNGLKVMVVENHKLPRVAFRLSLDNMPYAEGNKKGVADITSELIGSGTTKITKDVFNEEVDFLGANINFDSNGASASGLSKYSERILELMADGALNTVFTQEEFDKIKAKFLEGIKTQEKNVAAVAARVENVLTFGVDHPSGEFVSAESLGKVELSDVLLNYKTNFVPGSAYLVIVGDVNTKDVKKLVTKLFSSWKKANAPQIAYPDPVNVPESQIDFVDMPNAVQSEISVVNTVNLKITDKYYFAAILANQILGGSGGRLFLNLREKHGWTYGAYSGIGYGKYVEKFRSATSVRNVVTDSSVVEILSELKKIRTELVSAEDLKNAKAKYVGDFVMQIQKPTTVARYALNTETQNLPSDFYENYIKNINAVTVEDIKEVANQFFLTENTRIVVVGKGSEVAPALENLKIPMFYFDKYGTPIEKPVFKKEIPAGVTVKSVLDNYITAIGGEKAVKAVKTISMVGSTVIPQAPSPLTFTSKADVRGKLNVELVMGTMSLMKQVVTETSAYALQQGQRKDFEGAELAEMKSSTVLFEEIQLSKDFKTLQLDGIESFNGKDAYAIKNGKNTLYYDVTSGLKVADAKTIDQGGKSVTQITNFGDYRAVKGVKVPFNIIQNVGFELDIKMSEVTINEGVSDADFK
jgi:predicted Zn-dependent peptidase